MLRRCDYTCNSILRKQTTGQSDMTGNCICQACALTDTPQQNSPAALLDRALSAEQVYADGQNCHINRSGSCQKQPEFFISTEPLLTKFSVSPVTDAGEGHNTAVARNFLGTPGQYYKPMEEGSYYEVEATLPSQTETQGWKWHVGSVSPALTFLRDGV